MERKKADKKIAIACGCRKLNYGSLLQSYALCESIKKLGYQSNFVWVKGNLFKHYNIRAQKIFGALANAIMHPILVPKIIKSIYHILTGQSSDILSNNSIKYFDEFKNKYLDIKMYEYNELSLTNEYDAFVCGSDQIWNTYDVWLDPVYFLYFTSKKIAYAPSLGTNSIAKYNKKTVKKYLKNFKHISIREPSGANTLGQLLGREIPWVLDPTLLLSKEEWIEKLDLQKNNQKYCLVYFLDKPNELAKEIINDLRKKMKIITVPLDFDFYNKDEIVDAGPKEFLNLLYGAECVITDSFHGTIFSINFEKQFLTFPRNYKEGSDQSSRILDTLKMFNMSKYYINYQADINSLNKMIREKIDYKSIESILTLEKNRSISYLSNSIKVYAGGKND